MPTEPREPREPGRVALEAAWMVMIGQTNPSQHDIDVLVQACRERPNDLLFSTAIKWAIALEDYAAKAERKGLEAAARKLEEDGDDLVVYGDCPAGRMECRSACADVYDTLEALASAIRALSGEVREKEEQRG